MVDDWDTVEREPHEFVVHPTPTAWPESVRPLAAYCDVPVAGISRHQDNATDLLRSDYSMVLLHPQPWNEADPDAVHVTALWRRSDGFAAGGPIGYLPRDVARDVRAAFEGRYLHAKLVRGFLPSDDGYYSAGARLALGVSPTLDPQSVDCPLEAPPGVRRATEDEVTPTLRLGWCWCPGCHRQRPRSAPSCPTCGAIGAFL